MARPPDRPRMSSMLLRSPDVHLIVGSSSGWLVH
jgi:hypothetical protein